MDTAEIWRKWFRNLVIGLFFVALYVGFSPTRARVSIDPYAGLTHSCAYHYMYPGRTPGVCNN